MTRIRSTNHSEDIHAALRKVRSEANAKELELIELVTSIYEKAHDAQERAVDKILDTKTAVNTSVHLHPWYYIGGAAVCGLLVGMLLRRNH